MMTRGLVVCGVTVLALAPGAAWASKEGPGDSSRGGGERNGQEIAATASGIRFETSGVSEGGNAGKLAPVGDWDPPACWYEPKFTPKQFKENWEPVWKSEAPSGYYKNRLAQRYEQGKPYKDYNLDQQGEGKWWTGVQNEARRGDPEFNSCNEFTYFWVKDGEKPENPRAVSTKILAQLAYERIRVPDTEVELSPENRQTVNLATWAWLDKVKFKPVKVRAVLESMGISATTTAKPVSLKLEPGTRDARTYPASGECAIGDDGSIGTPYTKGSAKKTPPCGLTYLRSTAKGGGYTLKATVTWEVGWTGSDGDGGKLPDGSFGDTQQVTVQEVQSIVR